jgi:hypothetical protein
MASRFSCADLSEGFFLFFLFFLADGLEGEEESLLLGEVKVNTCGALTVLCGLPLGL